MQFDRKVLSIERNIRPPSSLYKPQDGGSRFVRKTGTSLSVCVRLWHLYLEEEQDVGKILCFLLTVPDSGISRQTVGVVYLNCFKVKKIYKLKCRDLIQTKTTENLVHLFIFLQHITVMGRTTVEEMREMCERDKERKEESKS